MLDFCPISDIDIGCREHGEAVTVSNGSDSELKPLPDPSICRTKDIGIKEFFECLVHCPQRCPHAVSFGQIFLCNHPDRHTFEKPDPKP